MSVPDPIGIILSKQLGKVLFTSNVLIVLVRSRVGHVSKEGHGDSVNRNKRNV